MCQNLNEFRTILINYRDYYGTYHHQKEMMAWLATALYLSFVAFLLGSDISILMIKYSRFIAAILFIIITMITFSFIRWQFYNRVFASAMVTGCTNLLTCILNGCQFKKDSFNPCTFKNYSEERWPKILVDTVEKEFKRNHLSEILTYFIIAILFFVGILNLWLASPCKAS